MPRSLPFLDYTAPVELENQVKIGQLVIIPFRNREEYGVIMELASDQPIKKGVKPISKIVFSHPALAPAQLDFLHDLSLFYGTSLGFLLKTNLPPLKKTKLAKIKLNKPQKKNDKREFAKPRAFYWTDREERAEFIAKEIAGRGQVLFLAPELAHIKEVVGSLPPALAKETLEISGELGDKEMFEKWMSLRQGEKRIVVGTRRALFLPWQNLTQIFVIDEANPNHKNWDMAPRTHNKDAALFLAKQHNAQVFFLSHTPSVENYYFTKRKIFSAKNDFAPAPVASGDPVIVDMRSQRRSGNYGFLSGYLLEKMNRVKSGDIFLFLNKRGSSSCVGCRDCGNIIKCQACGNSLVYHGDENNLQCHFCKTVQPFRPVCAVCRGVNMAMYGVGTQLAENTIKKDFGQDNKRLIIRLDSDSPVADALSDARDKIIIGTQLAWNKIDWSRVKLVAFLDADAPLFLPEYKATENIWYLLRDARFRLPTDARFIIQTSHPEHQVFSCLAEPEKFYEYQIKERRLLGYPPFNYLLKFYNAAVSSKEAEGEARQLFSVLASLTKDDKTVKLVGPLKMVPWQYGGKFSYVILAKIGFENYKKTTMKLAPVVPEGWKIDPNPESLLSVT